MCCLINSLVKCLLCLLVVIGVIALTFIILYFTKKSYPNSGDVTTVKST
ncbi:hypothetical protein TcasGA2_TC034836 [Tribolium castaneum]|uniref:Uncharacterized protein n=1 Tax=Tribolium castaneum TaxID=7070 RepID=A0A139WDA9_TRICA|nr:hypothetical protein TcasGA2_TC034836 [Tribolium castaneum]